MFFPFTFSFPWIRGFLFYLGLQFLHKRVLRDSSLGFPSLILYLLATQLLTKCRSNLKGSAKRKRPQKGSFLDTTTHTLVHIVDDFSIDEFRRDFNILANIDIQLLRSTTPLTTDTHRKHTMCFTRE